MAYSARSLSTNLLQQQITQTAHGFIVGDVISFNGTAYYLSLADDITDAQTVGMVSFVSDSNHFYVTQAGWVNNLTGPFTEGVLYYLDPVNPGDLTSVAPSTPGQYIVPLFIADTYTSGYYFNNAGTAVTSTTGFNTVVTSATTIAMVNDTRYFVDAGSTTTLTLPMTAAVGQPLIVNNMSGNSFVIAQNAGQSITTGSGGTTTVGTGGSLTSVTIGDSVTLICNVANTSWFAESTNGATLLTT